MFSLAPYRVSVEVNGKRINLLTKGKGFTTWLYAYLESDLGKINESGDKKVSRLARVCRNSGYTFICGKLQTGEFGYTSDIVNSKSSTVSHQRTTEEAELIPFFFSVTCPLQSDWAVLVLQKFKNLGIHDFLVPRLQFDFEKAHPDTRIFIERLVPTTLVNTLLDSSTIKAVRFVQYSMPKAVEDALLGTGYNNLNTHEFEWVLKPKRNQVLPMLEAFKELVGGKKNLTDIVAMPDKYDFDSIKLELDYAGRKRVVDLGKPFKVNPNIDITEDVASGNDGHPIWDQIMKTSLEFSKELIKTTGVVFSLDSKISEDKEAPKLKRVNRS